MGAPGRRLDMDNGRQAATLQTPSWWMVLAVQLGRLGGSSSSMLDQEHELLQEMELANSSGLSIKPNQKLDRDLQGRDGQAPGQLH